MAMAASMLFGCASESKTETTAAAGETTAAAAETTAEAAKAAKAETNGEKLKVTLLVTGSFGDKAFNDSAQAGMEKLEAELGDKVEVNMVEMGSDKTKFEGSMLDACESDADLIITGLWDMKEITKNIREMCIEANHFLSDDMKKVFNESVEKEESPLGKQILNQLQENLEIAGRDMIPICQDTGMAVVFIKVGQEVHIEGGNLTDAINEGVRQGYVDGYLRKSVVRDPIDRVNTKDNTPAIIHYEIVDGDQVDITVAPKGFGSENMSRVFMLKPADGIEGVKEKILEAVRDAGPNACPPMVVGVGIGGTFEKCALMAKHALTRNLEEESPVPYVRDLEKEMLEKINGLGIGPGGLGGRVTAMAVNIETYPTHIAGLPMAVNICCHVNRHAHRVI